MTVVAHGEQHANEEAEQVEMDAVDEGQVGGAESMSLEELAAVRELALRAYPETVPEMVGGGSVEEVLQSVEAASAAFQRIAEGVAARNPAPVAPVVPAGSAPPVTIDADRLPSVEKIRRGLTARG